MANILKVYINTGNGYETLDLFQDENVSFNSSVQNVKDISKLFTDYTQTFSVPASPKNNGIFKHYYNVDIVNLFNASVKVPSKLELNEAPFKDGAMRLDSVTMKKGKAHSYKITFFGSLTQLNSLFSDDELTDLDLSAYNHTYDHTTVKGLMAGTGDITYPLISTERDWVYYQNVKNNPNNIAYYTDFGYSWSEGDGTLVSGIRYNELRPALRIIRIIEAIETKYGITFSRDFFSSVGTNHFNDLFMWGNRKLEGSGIKLEGDQKWESLSCGDGTNIRGSVTEGNAEKLIYDPRFDKDNGPTNWTLARYGYDATIFQGVEHSQIRYTEYEVTVTPSLGYETVPYDFWVGTNDNEAILGTTGERTFTKEDFAALYWGVANEEHKSKDANFEKRLIDFKYKTEAAFTCNVTVLRRIRYREYHWKNEDWTQEAIFGPTLNSSESAIMRFNDKSVSGLQGTLPKITVKDFLGGLIKMFNLVIIPTSQTNFTVQTLDDWYADGNIVDISEFVDTSTHKVERPKLPSQINFKYEETKCVNGKAFMDINNKGYGDLTAPDIPSEGNPLNIEIPFENMHWVNLRYSPTTVNETPITVGKAFEVDDEGNIKAVETKPILFYNNYNFNPGNYTERTQNIQLNNNGAMEWISVYNLASSVNSIYQDTITQSLNFGEELVQFAGETDTPPNGQNGLNYSLFSNYWYDYISDLYNPNRRIFTFEAKLPINILNKVKLNDKLIIDDRRYVINNLKINLTSSDVKLELLNDIYDNAVSGQTHANINASSSRITCEKPSVTLNGAASTGVGLSYLWDGPGIAWYNFAKQSQVITVPGSYNLQVTDEFGISDNTTYVVTDARSTPSVTITPSTTELTYISPTITLTSSITTGYKFNWTTTDGLIVEGEDTHEIVVSRAGTYNLEVIQNNTGCSAEDSQIITTGDMFPPSIPDGLYTSGNTTTSSVLSWTASTDDVAIQNYDVWVDGVYYGTTVDTTPTLTINGLTNGDTVQFKVLARDTAGNTSDFSALFYQKVGGIAADGADGADANAVKLVSPNYIITYDKDGNNPTPSSIILTATTQNISTPWFRFAGDGFVDEGPFTVGTGNQDTITYTPPSTFTEDTTSEILVEVSDGDQIRVADDNISIGFVKAGTDSYTVILGNDSHTLVTDYLGTVDYTGSGTQIFVYKGSTQLAGITTGTPTSGQYKVTAVPTNITVGTITPGTPLIVGDHSAMTQDQTNIEYTIDVESLQTFTKRQTFSKSIGGTPGSSGTDSKVVVLNASSYVITYDSDGVETPAGQSITLTATQQNHSGTVYYDFLDGAVSKQNTTSNTYIIPDADEPIGGGVSNYTVNTREDSGVGTIIAVDGVSIAGLQDSADGAPGAPGTPGTNGTDGLTLIITNPAHTFAADSAGVVGSYLNSYTDIYVYEGSTVLVPDTTPIAGQWSLGKTASSITAGSSTYNPTYVRSNNTSNMTADQASINFTISGFRLDGTAFTLSGLQTFSKSRAGTDGTNGTPGTDGEVGRKSVTGYVYLTNGTTYTTPVPTTPDADSFDFSTWTFLNISAGWSLTAPENQPGLNYWISQYTVTEDIPGSDEGVPSFSIPRIHLNFTEVVSFTDLSTGGSTIINGDNITTGKITSDNFVSGTAPFSTSGTRIDLLTGSIESEGFGITTTGNASFNGAIVGGSIQIGSNFDVTSAGVVTASAMNIDGGTISIGSKFDVTSTGVLTASDIVLEGGTITSDNYVAGTAPFSTSGSKFNLANGSIETPGFGVTSTGNASFTGSITSNTVQIGTAATGERIQISSTTDDIRYYNSTGTLTGKFGAGLNDNSQLEVDIIQLDEYIQMNPSSPSALLINILWQDTSGDLWFRNKNSVTTKLN